MWGVTIALDELGGFFVDTIKPLLWGFNFLVGMVFVFIIKGVMKFFKKIGVQKRDYTNNFMLTRISVSYTHLDVYKRQRISVFTIFPDYN